MSNQKQIVLKSRWLRAGVRYNHRKYGIWLDICIIKRNSCLKFDSFMLRETNSYKKKELEKHVNIKKTLIPHQASRIQLETRLETQESMEDTQQHMMTGQVASDEDSQGNQMKWKQPKKRFLQRSVIIKKIYLLRWAQGKINGWGKWPGFQGGPMSPSHDPTRGTWFLEDPAAGCDWPGSHPHSEGVEL